MAVYMESKSQLRALDWKKGDVESQVGAARKVEDQWDDPRVSKGVIRLFSKGYVPLGAYREEETKGLLMESQGDCWVVRSYKVDGHNVALKAIMCSQCHVTPMGSYMFRFRKSIVLVETDWTHRVTHLLGCPSSWVNSTRRVWPVLLGVTWLIGWLVPVGLSVL